MWSENVVVPLQNFKKEHNMKPTLYSLITALFLISCSKNDPEKVNTAPTAFEVTAAVSDAGNEVVLAWTAATDADNDPINLCRGLWW